jgi:hypothetical protein
MKPENLKPEELYSLLEKEFHDSNKLWGDMASKYADASIKLFDDTIKFVYQALTAMGIIAGFGFAAIQGVQNFLLFSAGELTMFASMMFGFYRIKVIYVKNADSVDQMLKKIRTVMLKISTALGEMMKEVGENGKIKDKNNIKNYEDGKKELLELFVGSKKPEENKDESEFINWMIILFVIGFILLVFSFFSQNRFDLKRSSWNERPYNGHHQIFR